MAEPQLSEPRPTLAALALKPVDDRVTGLKHVPSHMLARAVLVFALERLNNLGVVVDRVEQKAGIVAHRDSRELARNAPQKLGDG